MRCALHGTLKGCDGAGSSHACRKHFRRCIHELDRHARGWTPPASQESGRAPSDRLPQGQKRSDGDDCADEHAYRHLRSSVVSKVNPGPGQPAGVAAARTAVALTSVMQSSSPSCTCPRELGSGSSEPRASAMRPLPSDSTRRRQRWLTVESAGSSAGLHGWRP
jgi:hypothetical protein